MTDFHAAVEIKPGRTYLIAVGPSWDLTEQLLAELERRFSGSEFLIVAGVTGIAEASGD